MKRLLLLLAVCACTKIGEGGVFRCNTDADCMAGHVCGTELKVCVPATCAQDLDCPQGFACDSNACVATPPNGINVDSIAPNPAKAGDTVQIAFTVGRTPSSCQAQVTNQAATCTASGRRCACSLLVTSALRDGSQVVNVSANTASGQVSTSAPLQIDETAPVINAGQISIVHKPIGTNDALSATAGAIVDGSPPYAGQKIVAVQMLSPDGGTLASITLAQDGSFAETPIPNSDGTAPDKLTPTIIRLRAIDVPGNVASTFFSTNADVTPPVVTASKIAITRTDVAHADTVSGAAGAIADAHALLQVRLAANGTLIATGPVNADGSFGPIAVGTAQSSFTALTAAGEDKTGNVSAPVAITAGADTTAPALDATKLTYALRPAGTSDAVSGVAAAATDTQSAVVRYDIYDSSDGGTLLASAAAQADGSFASTPVGDTALDRVWVSAVDKAGNAAARAYTKQVDAIVSLQDRAPHATATPLLSLHPWRADFDPRTAMPGAALVYADEAPAPQTTTATAVTTTSTAWTQLHGGAAPLVTSAGTKPLVYDSDRGVLMLIADPLGNSPLQVRELHGSWFLQPATGAPTLNTYAVVYDAARHKVVLAGGNPVQTWEYASGSWSQVATAHAPSPFYGAPLVYDPQRQRTVLVWTNDNSTGAVETWEYDGLDWTRTVATGAPQNANAAAYEANGRIVAVGNAGTFRYDGATWAAVTGGASWPGCSGDPAAVHDATRVLVFCQPQTTAFATYAFDGTNWSQVSTAHVPSAGPYGLAGAYDASRSVVVAYMQGGNAPVQYEFDGTDWSRNVHIDSPPRSSGRTTFEWLPWLAKAALHIGTSWTWDGDHWSYVTGDPPGGAFELPTFAVDPADALDFSNLGPSGLATFDGAAWKLLAGTNLTGCNYSVTGYDPSRGRLIVACFNTTNATFEWNGAAWATALANAPNRGPSFFDARRGTLFEVFQTIGSEYDGTAWTSPASGMPSAIYAAAWDPVSGAGLVASTSGASTAFYAYDGASWQPLTFAGAPARTWDGFTWDAANQRWLFFGGADATRSYSDLWALTLTTPHTRTAAHTLRARLPAGVTVSSASLSWSGAAVEVLAYDFTAKSWTSLGAGASVTAPLALTTVKSDHLWLMAAGDTSVSTSAAQVHVVYTLP